MKRGGFLKRRTPLQRGRSVKRVSARMEGKIALRKLMREVVLLRDQGKCRVCGCEKKPGRGGGLEVAHLLPKGQWRSMEFALENVLLMCHYHHFHWWHQEPDAATEWMAQNFGADYMPQLRKIGLMRASGTAKTDLAALRLYFEAELKKLMAA